MKKFLIVTILALVATISYGQKQDGRIVIGTISGFGVSSWVSGLDFSGNITRQSNVSVNYGGWIDLGRAGIQVVRGAYLTGDDPWSYIYGDSKRYTSGGVYTNIGVFFDAAEINGNTTIFSGVGFQTRKDITTDGYIDRSKPYLSVGVDKNVWNKYVVRGEFTYSGVPSLNIGFGFKL